MTSPLINSANLDELLSLLGEEPRRPPKVLHLWPPKLLHLTSGDLMH